MTQDLLFEIDDPFKLFDVWFAEACEKEVKDPTAMALATVDDDFSPNVRIVLMKHVDWKGFVYYTNRDSIKGVEIAKHPCVALCFYWKSLGRQVRVKGKAHYVSESESDAYFASRPRDSQIGAWASSQSQKLAARTELEERIDLFTKKFEGRNIERPPQWGGYRVSPLRIEFWQERPFRLHDRRVFERDHDNDPIWRTYQLYP